MPQHTYTIKNNEGFQIMKVKKEKEFIKTKINWIQIQMLHKKSHILKRKNKKMNLYTTKFTDTSIKKCWFQINIEILG